MIRDIACSKSRKLKQNVAQNNFNLDIVRDHHIVFQTPSDQDFDPGFLSNFLKEMKVLYTPSDKKL